MCNIGAFGIDFVCFISRLAEKLTQRSYNFNEEAVYGTSFDDIYDNCDALEKCLKLLTIRAKRSF